MSIPEGGLYNDAILSAGKITEHHPATYTITGHAEGAIPFGVAVVRGTTPEGVKVPTDASAPMVGVAAYSFEASDLDNEKYAADDVVGIVQIGVVSVVVTEAVKPADEVRVILTGDNAGSFCKTATVAVTAVVKGAEWRHEATDAGLAELYINGPLELIEDEE